MSFNNKYSLYSINLTFKNENLNKRIFKRQNGNDLVFDDPPVVRHFIICMFTSSNIMRNMSRTHSNTCAIYIPHNIRCLGDVFSVETFQCSRQLEAQRDARWFWFCFSRCEFATHIILVSILLYTRHTCTRW